MLPDPQLADFHFIRPLWLLLIPCVLWVHMRLRRAYSASIQWKGSIAPELLTHLTVAGRNRVRIRPYQLMTCLLTLIAIVLAGPAWEREITPFTQDQAPLIIAIELTPSMLCIDQEPTRLDRARFKLRDLLARRRGSRTAVIGYAGSAHLLLPFTDDTDLLEVYLDALHPNLMPTPGDSPERALELAADLLAKESVSGTLLFLTDGITERHAEQFSRFVTRSKDQLILLAFGTDEGGETRADGMNLAVSFENSESAPPVYRHGLEAISSATRAPLVYSSLYEADVDSVMLRINRHFIDAINEDEETVWRDRGYPIVWLIAAGMIVWFRRGWTVQWRV